MALKAFDIHYFNSARAGFHLGLNVGGGEGLDARKHAAKLLTTLLITY